MKKFLIFLLISFIAISCTQNAENQYRIVSSDSNNKSNKKPLILLHDGPGLTYTYIAKYLMPLNKTRNLIFYDQLNCYQRDCSKKPVEISDLIKQLEDITKKYNNFGIIAHGWGSIILMEYLLNTPKQMHPDEVILITPAPFNWIDLSRNIIEHSKKYKKEDEKKLAEVKNPNQCLDALKIISKYSLYNSSQNIPFDRYDCILAGYLMNRIKDYNYEAFSYLLPKKTLWITGEKDFFKIRKENKPVFIKKSGHYPFIENNKDFIKEIKKFFMTS